METWSFAAGIAGTVVALLALVLVIYVERVTGPKLTVEMAKAHRDPRGFDYLHVAVKNLAYEGICGTGLLRGTFTRQAAIGCTVTVHLTDRPNGLQPWTAMWSAAGQPEICGKAAQSLIPLASRWDVQPTGEQYLVPIVIHWRDKAETYAHDGWNFCAGNRSPARRIPPGQWTLRVVAVSGQATAEATFALSVPDTAGMKATLEDSARR